MVFEIQFHIAQHRLRFRDQRVFLPGIVLHGVNTKLEKVAQHLCFACVGLRGVPTRISEFGFLGSVEYFKKVHDD
jgi:hypothetical protein